MNAVFVDTSGWMACADRNDPAHLACTAALAYLHVLETERLVENAAAMGERITAGLRKLIGQYEMVKDVRGKGLMIAVEFGPPSSLRLKVGWSLLHKLDAGLFPQAILVPLYADHGVLAQVAGHHMDVIKFIPSLVITEQDADFLVTTEKDGVKLSAVQLPVPCYQTPMILEFFDEGSLLLERALNVVIPQETP